MQQMAVQMPNVLEEMRLPTLRPSAVGFRVWAGPKCGRRYYNGEWCVQLYSPTISVPKNQRLRWRGEWGSSRQYTYAA